MLFLKQATDASLPQRALCSILFIGKSSTIVND